MTDRELVIELVNRIAKYNLKKDTTNYNNVLNSSAECITIGNLCYGENIDFLFSKDGKIIGISC